MRFLGTVSLIGAFATISVGQNGPNQAEAIRTLGSAMQRAGAQLIWSYAAGRLQTGDTRAVFTVLAVKDPERVGQQIRGVRVVASSHDWNGTIYVEEPELRLLQQKVEIWAKGAERFAHTVVNGVYSTACPEDEYLHLPLAFGYVTNRQSAPRLLVDFAGFAPLSFNGHSPSDVAAIFARATA